MHFVRRSTDIMITWPAQRSSVCRFLNIFTKRDVTDVLKNRFVVVIGDSIQRGIYKDLVLMLQNDRYLTQNELRSKGEFEFLSDELIEGGRKDKMSNGISYKEVRQYHTDVHLVRFYFMTRCYNAYMETILRDLREGPTPDVIIMNSCLWDITRYGSDSIMEYKQNLQTLFARFRKSLPERSLVIWTTTLPISSSARGGFLVPEIEFMSTTLRLDILEANFYAKTLATSHGFDVLDLHFYLRHYLHCRVKDGIHWDMMAHRYITNLLMSHVIDAWGMIMPPKTSRTFGSYGSVAGAQRRYNEWTNSQSNFGWNYGNSFGENNGYRERSCNNWAVSGRCNNNFETRNNWNPSYRPFIWNGPCDQVIRPIGQIRVGHLPTQNFHWQSYEESSYHAHAPNRRHVRRHPNNPYFRPSRF
ncbi:PC-esterase domain-containing protein 1A-like [Elysia marginata]|uniref:PC-esterase domain-containing protein 1A-like n=1 Tax=Elysia marginata TaxID=1093978 RepID=A0AAV4J7B2_9GAST|nr:PC-esterase domain-containing protein 1A-like [Elysia marginata]